MVSCHLFRDEVGTYVKHYAINIFQGKYFEYTIIMHTLILATKRYLKHLIYKYGHVYADSPPT